MAKIRVYELARELELDSKDVLEAARDLGAEVKTASSGLDPEEAELVRQALVGAGGSGGAEAVPAPEAPEPVEEPEPAEEPEPVEEPDEVAAEVAIVSVPSGVTPAQLAEALGVAAGDVVAALIGLGEAVGMTSPIPADALELVGEQFNALIEVEAAPEPEPAPAPSSKPSRDRSAGSEPRPPVVTVMGHVDHGKTTLLDTIRSTSVAEGEHGGITQHIGAYQVPVGDEVLTFLDTPGHEAFTALRARGADVTDIVILVVAADDGIMPQTAEAISHAKAAGVPIIVAVNKMDLPGADPYSVRAQLTEHGVVVEELGGDVPSVEISALKGEGVDQLLEMVDLVAELEEFRGEPKGPAKGVIIESRLDVGLGPVATVIVQEGTLKQGDALLSGPISGRVRAMRDHNGELVKAAGPSTPVLVQGWGDVPTAGDAFEVVKNEREARKSADAEAERLKSEGQVIPSARDRLAQLLEQLRTADEAELNLIVKADAHGSLEAIRDAIAKISREGGTITITHGAVGGITENDVSLAEVTEAIVIGFNVRPDANARRAAEKAGVEIRTYNIIYELLDEIEQMLVGRLAPEELEVIIGSAEIREVFKTPRSGNIAGSYVTEGNVQRGAKARLLRDGVVIHTGSIGSLRRFKDDVREVASGFECGIGLENYNDVKVGDVIELFEIQEIART
jgi:translation initiation factor IF-2